MYTLISFVIVLILSSSSSLVNAQCSASVSAKPRQGSSWSSNGVAYQLYDITAVNTGSAAITALHAFFGYPSDTSVSSSWNYDPSNGEITGFGSSLATQASASSAGFTLAGSGTPSLAYVTPICGGMATNAPTSAPTDAPTQQNCFNQCSATQICVALTSAGPKCNPRNCDDAQCGDNQVCIDDGGVARCITESTPAPTVGPATIASSGSCAVSVQAVRRPNGTYMQGSTVTTIWDLVFTSHGPATIDTLDIVISLEEGTTVSQQWNMSPRGSGSIYSVSSYGGLNHDGASYTSAGFVTAGSGIKYVSVSSVSCA